MHSSLPPDVNLLVQNTHQHRAGASEIQEREESLASSIDDKEMEATEVVDNLPNTEDGEPEN